MRSLLASDDYTKRVAPLHDSIGRLCHAVFILLLTLKLYEKFFTGLLLVMWLYLTVYVLNSQIKKCFFDAELRRKCFLLATVGIIYLIALHVALSSQGLFYVFLFQPPKIPVSSLYLALWYIVLLDCSLKLVAVFVKSVVILSLRSKFYAAGSTVSVVENVFAILRHVPSGVVWVCFFCELSWPEQGSLAGRIIITILYAILKIIVLSNPIKSFWKSLRTLRGAKPYLTETHTDTENPCELCQESFVLSGVLSCNHKFCINCVERWCNLLNTCPMCDYKFQETSNWRDGSTSLYIQFY